tara:strand:+ start:513 stop:866 length:354 start_codon:yes stop_codon:yes gene_type:complete
MGRIQSKRITGDTNVVELLPASLSSRRENPCTFAGIVVSAIDADATIGDGTGDQIISIYSDNTGTGTTNLVMRISLIISNTNPHFIFKLGDDGILCHSGLRVECDNWTNLEAFVLYC